MGQGKVDKNLYLYFREASCVEFSAKSLLILWDIFWSWDYGFGAWQAWIFSDFQENSQHQRALSRVLLGVRSQVIYQKVPTPRAWSIARVKSRVARFYARIFLRYSECIFWKSSSGDADHPILNPIATMIIHDCSNREDSDFRPKFQNQIESSQCIFNRFQIFFGNDFI